MYAQVGELCLSWIISTVPLTWFSPNMFFFFKNQNAYNAGNMCVTKTSKLTYYHGEDVVHIPLWSFNFKWGTEMSDIVFWHSLFLKETMYLVDLFWDNMIKHLKKFSRALLKIQKSHANPIHYGSLGPFQRTLTAEVLGYCILWECRCAWN